MEILAIIPARGGSKGLPGKNTRSLAGIPLITYTIKAAMESKSITRIIVSTDDESISTVATEAGAEVPFLRPANLSGDQASGIDTCLHALEYANNKLDYQPEHVAYLQPTSPLRTASDIDTAANLLTQSGADSVISLKAVTEYPQWMKTMDVEHRINPLFELSEIATTRQNLEKSYILNGAIYLSTTPSLKNNKSFYGDDTRGYLMPDERSIDIDTLNDFYIAEALLSHKES